MSRASAHGKRILTGLGIEVFGNCSCGLACPCCDALRRFVGVKPEFERLRMVVRVLRTYLRQSTLLGKDKDLPRL